jgi:hypothetical protein
MAGVLIRSYGELWSPDLVNWGKRGPGGHATLLGEFGPKRSLTVVDVWEQRGIYVLLHEWQVVYVGKADGFVLGARLRTHLSDALAGRWDRFSWYGIRGVLKNGRLGADMGNKQTSASELIGTFESLLIAVTEPPRNRRREEIPGAQLVVQHGADRPRAPASYLDELRGGMREVVARLTTIEARLPAD